MLGMDKEKNRCDQFFQGSEEMSYQLKLYVLHELIWYAAHDCLVIWTHGRTRDVWFSPFLEREIIFSLLLILANFKTET